MRKIVFILLLACSFVACNPETVKIKGHIDNAIDGTVLVKMKTRKKCGERVLDTLKLESGHFNFFTETTKPPVKLTFIINNEEEFDVWLGNYGSCQIKGEYGKLDKVEVYDSFLHDEIQKIQNKFYKWYLSPVQDKIDWLNSYEKDIQAGKTMNLEAQVKKMEFQKDVDKARKLRRLSIVKTVRKNPSSPTSLALVNEEYDALVSRHKKEMLKLLSTKFSDTGLYWQLRP